MDTIGLILKRESVPNTNLLSEIPKHLTELYNDGEIVKQFGIETINGKLGDFKVNITANKIKISGASLQKFIDGNSISPFGKSRINQAFEKLGDTLHLPIKNNGEMFMFHFAKNVSLKYEPNLYLPYLGNYARFKRCEQPNGLNYKVENREFAIYNKIKELKYHREPIPPIYVNSNIMRLENRYHRQITKYFNRALITPNNLLEDGFYINLNNDLAKTYLTIDKLKKIKIDMENITTKKEYEKLGVLSLIEMQGGKLEALKEIEERYKKGKLTKKQAFDLRHLIKQCSTLKIQTIESELITELNQKVKESIEYFR